MRVLLFLAMLFFIPAGCIPENKAIGGPPPAFEEIEKIDLHAHIFEYIPGFAEVLKENNLRLVNICVVAVDPARVKWMEAVAELMHLNYGRLHPFACTFPLDRIYEPGYQQRVERWLDNAFEQGAALTKLWKEVGMELKTPSGDWLMPDDPLFDPIYDHLAKRGKPLIAHLAEPKIAWLPLAPGDSTSYYATHPEWHFYGREDVPSYERIIAARDNILQKHPNLTFIGAHLGSLEHDVDMIAERLERYPNFQVELGSRTVFLAQQPSAKVREFLIRYQDRVMYGTDIARVPGENEELEPDKRPEFFRSVLETYRRDYNYYSGNGMIDYNGKQVEALALPREVLEKVYAGNARRIIPGLDN